jgi:hypothetical protein
MSKRTQSKTVELTIRVNVPKRARIAHVKRAVANAWYGKIYLDIIEECQIGRGTLYPKIVSARLKREPA